jgi:hypothetical protein
MLFVSIVKCGANNSPLSGGIRWDMAASIRARLDVRFYQHLGSSQCKLLIQLSLLYLVRLLERCAAHSSCW